MASETVNYVENSLLAYVASVRHSKTKHEIINVCSMYYDESVMKIAKEIAFEAAKTKLIWRRSENKLRENFSDIVDLFQKCNDEGIKLPRFVTADHDAFPPSYGFDIIGGYISKLTDQIDELKNEVQGLKDTRMSSISFMEDQLYIKEELLDIKGLLKQCKQKNMFEAVKRDSILVENIDKLLEDSIEKNVSCGENRTTSLNDEVNKLLSSVGTPSAPTLSQIMIDDEPYCETDDVPEDHNVSPLMLPSYREVLCTEDDVSIVAHLNTPQSQLSAVESSNYRVINHQKDGDRLSAGNAVRDGGKLRVNTTVINEGLKIDNPSSDDRGPKAGNSVAGHRSPRAGTSVSNDGGRESNYKRKSRVGDTVIDAEGFTLVQNRRQLQSRNHSSNHDGTNKKDQRQRRPVGVRGTKTVNNSKFKGTCRTVDIYIGNVDLESDSNDIITFTKEELDVNVIKCVELESQRIIRDWKSFKLTIAIEDREQLFQPDCWPNNVIVRKFYTPKSVGNG